jgi:hypothetical protein
MAQISAMKFKYLENNDFPVFEGLAWLMLLWLTSERRMP